MILILYLILPIRYFFSCHEIILKCSESCIISSRWLQNKNAAVNPQNNKYDDYFKYAATLTYITKIFLTIHK